MKRSKMDEMIDNYTNGNISDFKAALKRLTKRELADLLKYLTELNRDDVVEAVYRYV